MVYGPCFAKKQCFMAILSFVSLIWILCFQFQVMKIKLFFLCLEYGKRGKQLY